MNPKPKTIAEAEEYERTRIIERARAKSNEKKEQDHALEFLQECRDQKKREAEKLKRQAEENLMLKRRKRKAEPGPKPHPKALFPKEWL